MDSTTFPSVRRALPILLTLLCIAGLLGLSATRAASAGAAVKPQNDHTRLPKSCASAKELIPQEPTVCKITRFRDDRPTLLVWGDSHAWMMIPALQKAVEDADVNLVAIVMGGCPPMDNLVGVDDAAPGCYRSNALALDFVQQVQDSGEALRVVLGGSWQRYRAALRAKDKSYTGEMARAMVKGTPRLMKTLARRGVATDVVGQVATVPADAPACRRENPYTCTLSRRAALPTAKDTQQYLLKVMKPLAGNRAPINVNGAFCDGNGCRGKIGAIYTWWDDLHLSATRSRTLAPSFARTVTALVDADTSTGGGDGGGGGGGGCSIPLLCF
ncbi:SGNH hydrolase domain-containing protein [Nocardioides sp.]|uniref:SGNH hydrolase domain-containing protein n=1 Tax=Nocardioides sp. TaxID=35761 RepID=UPI00351377A5